MHVIIDGKGGDYKRMWDETFIHMLLFDYPATIGMTRILGPFVTTYKGSTDPKDWGISGIVVIAESHISIHTFPERDYINIDVFSCKEFDAQKVISDFKKAFRLKKLKTNILERGLKYVDAFWLNEIQSLKTRKENQ